MLASGKHLYLKPRLKSGHFTCYFNRTYHVLTTEMNKALDTFFAKQYSLLAAK